MKNRADKLILRTLCNCNKIPQCRKHDLNGRWITREYQCCGTIEPLRRKIEHFSSKAKKTCANVESLGGINKSFSVHERPALQGESARETSCQNTARKSFSDRESTDVKAMVNDYENSHEIIIPRNCHMIDRS